MYLGKNSNIPRKRLNMPAPRKPLAELIEMKMITKEEIS